MFDSDFRKIIIFSAVFGLLGILLLMYYFETSELSVSAVSENHINKTLSVTGNVKYIALKSNTLFFELCDSSACISCVYFNPSKKLIIDLKELQESNKEITVKARYQKYYETKELIVYGLSEKGEEK